MKHLTETQLNEYLDGVPEAPAQARLQAHLADCADCRARLAALQTVFQALASLPDELPEQDLTVYVLQTLPHRAFSWLGWRLALALQAGFSLGILLLLSPFLSGRIAGVITGMASRLVVPEIKVPGPVFINPSLPVFPVPHLPGLVLPVTITQANLSIWLVLGIAASLLFVVGNFSLLIHKTSKAGK